VTITVKASSTYSRGGGLSVQDAGAAVGWFAGLDSLGRLYAHGGIGSGTTMDSARRELERYDPATNVWTTLAASIQYQQAACYIVDSQDRIIYATGAVIYPSSFTAGTNRGEIYDPVANSWTALTNTIPNATIQGRRRALSYRDGFGRLVITMGLDGFPSGSLTYQDGGANLGHPIDKWTYTGGASGTWSQITMGGVASNLNPLVRHEAVPTQPTTAGPDGRLYSPNSFYIYWTDAAVTTWQRLDVSTPLLGGGRYSGGSEAAVVHSDGYLYVVGGFKPAPGAGAVPWVIRFDPVAGTAVRLTDLPWAVAGGQLVSFGTCLYLIGGYDLTAAHAEILGYNAVTDTWSTVDTLSVARSGIAVVPTLDGTGYWLYSGNTNVSGQIFGGGSGFSNVLELWIPPSCVSRGRSYAQVVG
jgi:hypothetical protein